MQLVSANGTSSQRDVAAPLVAESSAGPLPAGIHADYAPPTVNSLSPIDPTSLWPVRFWDETVGLLHLFEKHREQDDNINARACFSRLAQYRYLETSKRPGYDRQKRSIVSFFQPKSAGTYLHNRLLQLGYQDFWWFFPSRMCHSYCFASAAALELFILGGCTCHSHGRPDPNILAAFDRAGVGFTCATRPRRPFLHTTTSWAKDKAKARSGRSAVARRSKPPLMPA
jgi:hypothetical protein